MSKCLRDLVVWLFEMSADIWYRTLQGMFPNLDKEVISDVVRQKEGRVRPAVDACLLLSG